MNTLRKYPTISFPAILILIPGLTVDFSGVLAFMVDLSGPQQPRENNKTD